MATSPFALPLIGRAEELARLESIIAAVEAGRSATLLLVGEGGAGKTRLARAAAEAAARRGFAVAEGRAYSVESGVPYAVFADALAPTLRRLDAAALNVLTRGAAGELVHIFPGLLSASHPERGASGESASEAKARLYWTFVQLLGRLAARQPLLLLLDNLQWADAASLELLHFVARQAHAPGLGGRVLIVGTYNDADAVPALLRDAEQSLVALGAARVERVTTLSADETLELVRRSFDVSVESVRGFASMLHEWTRGNPFFIEETLKSLVESGQLQQRDGRWSGWSVESIALPRTVRDAVLARVERLSAGARALLDFAAVHGARVRYATLRAVSEAPDETLIESLDELCRARLLVESDEAKHDGYDFSHPLVRDAVYGALGRRRAQLLHAQIAAALERLHGAEAGAHATPQGAALSRRVGATRPGPACRPRGGDLPGGGARDARRSRRRRGGRGRHAHRGARRAGARSAATRRARGGGDALAAPAEQRRAARRSAHRGGRGAANGAHAHRGRPPRSRDRAVRRGDRRGDTRERRRARDPTSPRPRELTAGARPARRGATGRAGGARRGDRAGRRAAARARASRDAAAAPVDGPRGGRACARGARGGARGGVGRAARRVVGALGDGDPRRSHRGRRVDGASRAGERASRRRDSLARAAAVDRRSGDRVHGGHRRVDRRAGARRAGDPRGAGAGPAHAADARAGVDGPHPSRARRRRASARAHRGGVAARRRRLDVGAAARRARRRARAHGNGWLPDHARRERARGGDRRAWARDRGPHGRRGVGDLPAAAVRDRELALPRGLRARGTTQREAAARIRGARPRAGTGVGRRHRCAVDLPHGRRARRGPPAPRRGERARGGVVRVRRRATATADRAGDGGRGGRRGRRARAPARVRRVRAAGCAA